MIQSEESIGIHSKKFIERKKAFYLKRFYDIRDTLNNIPEKNQDSNISDSKKNKLVSSFINSENFIETKITLSSSRQSKKNSKKKQSTNFNLLFPKNTNSSLINNPKINSNHTQLQSPDSKNINKDNISGKYRSSNNLINVNYSKKILNVKNSSELPKLNSHISSKIISNNKTRNFSIIKENNLKECDDNIISPFKTSKNISSNDFNKKLIKSKCDMVNDFIILNDLAKGKSNNLNTQKSSGFSTNRSIVYNKTDGLLTTFLNTDPVEVRLPDKFNFLDCLAVDNLYNSHNPINTIQKENVCSKMMIERAKHIYNKNKLIINKDIPNLQDYSKEILNKKEKYLEERKKMVIMKTKHNLFRMMKKK